MRIKEIQQIKYNNDIIYYQLKTGMDTFCGYVNKYTALWIAKRHNLKIKKATKITIALNFKPQYISNNIII